MHPIPACINSGWKGASRLRFPDGNLGWLVTSHEIARTVLKNDAFSVTTSRNPAGINPERTAELQNRLKSLPVHTGVMLEHDPPNHTRLRRLAGAEFTIKRVKEYRPQVERIVDRQIEALLALGPGVDLVTEFSLPVAGGVHCVLLGVPEKDLAIFETASTTMMNWSLTVEERMEGYQRLCGYVANVIASKRHTPGNDLLSHAIHQNELSDDEMVGFAALLFEAGRDTTASMLSLGAMALMNHREQLAKMLDNSVPHDAVVDELLRYVTVFQLGAFARTASQDVVIEGTRIKRGESVIVSLWASNHDPAVFPEPDQLKVDRDARRHMAFSHGIHICLGQHLARLELSVGLSRLFERIPTLAPASAAEIEYVANDYAISGINFLPVTW